MWGHSLTRRLCVLVALVTVVMAGAAGKWAYFEAFQAAQDLQDNILAQVASIAAARTITSAVPLDAVPISDADTDIDVTSLAKSGLPADTPNGFGTADIHGKSRRFFLIRNSSGAELVVSQSVEIRDRTARTTAIASAAPLLLLVPTLLAAICLVVRKVMKPVNELAQQVIERDDTDLRPLPTEDAPEELRAFLIALNSQFAQASNAIERKRLFIAKAAHELRTPLTAMSLQLERAANAPDNTQLRRRLTELGGGVERSRNLISQLLDLAQAQAQIGETEPPQPLDAIVRQVITDLLPLADRVSVELDADLTDAGDQVLPAAATTSILRNLVDNAIRYNCPGGHVHVSAQIGADGLIVMVDDDGVGISSPRDVLQPFAREAGQDNPGSGLGLAIVAEQVRHLDGQLDLLPTLRYPQGTAAVVSLPVRHNSAVAQVVLG